MAEKRSVSCIIPTYNRANFIGDAIRSIQEQTYPVEEIIIIDDGSTDDTASVLRAIDEPRLRYHYQPNAGISNARNVGIRMSSGSIVAFLDSDDLWLPTKLEKQIDCLLSGNHGLVYCPKSWINNTGADIPNPYPQRTFPQGSVFRDLFLANFVTSASCVITQRKCFDDVGTFTESHDLTNGEDYELWLRIARSYSFGVVPEELVKYRMHGANQTKARPRRYRGTLAALYSATQLDPDRTLISARDCRNRLAQVYTLAVSEFFYSYDLISCRHFGYEAISKGLVSPSLLLFTLLAHLPSNSLKFLRAIYPW